MNSIVPHVLGDPQRKGGGSLEKHPSIAGLEKQNGELGLPHQLPGKPAGQCDALNKGPT